MNKFTVLRVIFILVVLASCSTAPRKPGAINELSMRSEYWLELGNKESDRGNLETALDLLNESKNQAVLADDPGLLIRTGLSKGNVLLSLGRTDEAFTEWEQALGEAGNIKDSELEAVSRVHIIRGNLLSGNAAAQRALDEVNHEISSIKKDQYYVAFAWLVAGLCQRELGRFPEAENSVRRSLAIHERGRFYEQAAYDWFLIASIRSLAGNYNGALSALQSAIELDRRMENSFGLASDWRAMGDVLAKAGRAEESRQAYQRAAAILRAMGEEGLAAELDKRAE
ncbi:MAG: hypothetical protein FWG99_00615 [Treponema sp.]|nr:hypothetical protein [Treponema sp.]